MFVIFHIDQNKRINSSNQAIQESSTFYIVQSIKHLRSTSIPILTSNQRGIIPYYTHYQPLTASTLQTQQVSVDIKSTMMHTTIDTQEIQREARLGMDSSLHHEDFHNDLNESSDVRTKPITLGKIPINDISMNLTNILQEMEEKRGESHCDSISIGSSGTNLIGSKLRLDDLPSSQGNGLDWGSFHKSTSSSGSSSSSSSRRLLRRQNDSAPKPEHGEPDLVNRKKVVRFKKFETVFQSCESMS